MRSIERRVSACDLVSGMPYNRLCVRAGCVEVSQEEELGSERLAALALERVAGRG